MYDKCLMYSNKMMKNTCTITNNSYMIGLFPSKH